MNPKQYKNLDFSKLSKQEIIDTQKYLIKKGYLDQSFVNARGETKSSADGIWGKRSQSAMNKFLQEAETSGNNSENNEEESSNPLWSKKGLLWNIADAKTSNNVPNDWMPQTRSGKATPEDIARERMDTVGKYITDDFGYDAQYKTAEYQGTQRRVLGAENPKSTKAKFDKEWTAAGNNPGTLYEDITPEGPIAPEYIIRADAKRPDDYKTPLVNPIFLPENIEYVRALQRRLNYTPSSVNVQTHSLKANGSQQQLSDIDRKQWTHEYNTELLQNAELYSQLNAARVEIDNALTEQQRKEAQKKYDDLAHRIALSNNAKTFSLNGQKTQSFPQEYTDLIQQAEKQGVLSEELRSALQRMYDRYGASPQWSHMNWGEKYTLDHLHGAGYSYNDESGEGNKIVGDIGQKLTDAISGRFTPRTLNGKDNGYFVLIGDRQGVNRHLNQRGENITNWQYNTAPKDANGKVMDKPYFQIGSSMAWDYSTGKPRVALSTTDNFHYRSHQQNNPMFTTPDLYNNPFKDEDLETFNKWSEDKKREAGDWLKEHGFNIEDKSSLSGIKHMLTTGEVPYDYNAVKSIYQKIKNARESFINPSEGQQSGKNSFYYFPMSQGSQYTSNIFENSLTGVQMIDGKPHVFNQDLYDISTGPLKMFGNATWYKNIKELSDDTWALIKRSAQE